jgi:hypothetical protein
MKLALIEPGKQYVVAVKRQHILIPGTEITYVERHKMFEALPMEQWNALPRAGRDEHTRLGRAWRDGLESRLGRCTGVYAPQFDDGHLVGHESLLRHARLGIVATVISTRPRAVLVEAEFVAERGGLLSRGDAFNPNLPEEPDEDASDEEIDAWIDAYEDACRDRAGTLRAIVHPVSVKYAWTDDLIERLDAEHEEKKRRKRAEAEQRHRAMLERHAGEIMEREAEAILREANRPPDDEWEALA